MFTYARVMLQKLMTFFYVINKQVNMLQRLLDQEEKVHEILDMVNNRPNNSPISIPNFLPPKVIYNFLPNLIAFFFFLVTFYSTLHVGKVM